MAGGLEYCDEEKNYIAPTVILEPSWDAQIMKEEIFGPILPIKTYKSIDEVIE